MSKLRLSAALFVVALLAACSGGIDPATNRSSTITGLTGELINRLKKQPPLPVVDRAFLDQLTTASLEVTLENRDLTAYLIPLTAEPPLIVWRTADFAQVVTRGGLVTTTRSIGNDLASSDYASTLQAIAAGTGTTRRNIYLRNDLAEQERITLACSIQRLGTVRLEIIERFFDAVHLRENCSYPGGEIVNDYWLDPGDNSRMWQSRQWLGPYLGYARLRLLRP